jgi:hypothetical protein
MGGTANVDEAVHRTIHEFPKKRGLSHVESAAQAIGRSAGTVYNKADPACETHQVTVREALILMTSAGDFRILQAIGTACDHAVVHLAQYRHTSDIELLDLMCREQRAAGKKADAIGKALGDGRIDKTELRDISAAFYEQIRATLELLSRLEAIAHESR